MLSLEEMRLTSLCFSFFVFFYSASRVARLIDESFVFLRSH